MANLSAFGGAQPITPGGLVELGYGQTTSNTLINNATAGTGTEVIAPVTVVCDGSPILVEFFSPEARPSTTANDEMNISLFEDSSEKIRSWGRNYNGAGGFNNKPAYLSVRLTPSAGSHTYGVKAYVTDAARAGSVGGGTGTSTTSAPCFLRVSKIVQATQWPAVTTSTIICTSSTRPASPFEGQVIYETDTDKQLVWNASAWKQVAGSSATFSDDLTVSGMLYQPNKPMFSARATAGTTATGTWTTYADVFVNVGNNFNTTNGLFTAPVAAKYFFTFSAFTEAGTSAQVYFLLNGVAYNRTYTANGTTTYVALNPGIVIFNLAAGDTVGVYINVGQTHWNQNNYFSGWMLG